MIHYARGYGSPYDRGRADSYYRRSRRPHWIDHNTGGARVTDLTPEERAEYFAGYDQNEYDGDKKDYGW